MQIRYTLVFGFNTAEEGSKNVPVPASVQAVLDALAAELNRGILDQAQHQLAGYLGTVLREKKGLLIGTRLINDPAGERYPSRLLKVQPFFEDEAVVNMRLRAISIAYYGAVLPAQKRLGCLPKTCYHNGRFPLMVEVEPGRKIRTYLSCRRKQEKVILTLPIGASDQPGQSFRAFQLAQLEVEARLRALSTVQMQILRVCTTTKTASA